jgi:hypothetical protein
MSTAMLISLEVQAETGGWTRITEVPESCRDRPHPDWYPEWSIIRNNWLMNRIHLLKHRTGRFTDLAPETVFEFTEYTDDDEEWLIIDFEDFQAFDWAADESKFRGEVEGTFIRDVYVPCMREAIEGRTARVVLGWNN